MAVFALGEDIPSIDPTAFVHPDATIIGSVVIGPGGSIWPSAVIRADTSVIQIGARTSIQDGSVIHTSAEFPTWIGDDCVVGHLVHIEGAIIEDHCLIGSGAIVLNGAKIGERSLIGAGSLVTPSSTIPPGSLAMGSPARVTGRPVPEGVIDHSVESYRKRAIQFTTELRPLDYTPGQPLIDNQ